MKNSTQQSTAFCRAMNTQVMMIMCGVLVSQRAAVSHVQRKLDRF